MPKLSPVLDNFFVAFGQFMKSGETDALSLYCESGTNTELFSIYRNGYYRACIGALTSNYPATFALLGDNYFRSIAKTYVTQWPPESGSLAGYGSNFPDYLQMANISRNLPYLADVARLDSAWLDVYFSSDNAPLTPEHISELAQGESELNLEHIVLTKSATVLSLNYPVADIWRKLKDFGRIQHLVELNKSLECVLVWRYKSEVMLRRLTHAEFEFFAGFGEGLSLELAVENAYGDDSEFELDTFFLNLITTGLLTVDTTLLQLHQQEF